MPLWCQTALAYVFMHEISGIQWDYENAPSEITSTHLCQWWYLIIIIYHNIQWWHRSFLFLEICNKLLMYICIRCLMVSTNQADPGWFYFRISWILMERRLFYFSHPHHFLQGLRSLKYWLLQKLSMKIFDQKFRFLIKSRYFGGY